MPPLIPIGVIASRAGLHDSERVGMGLYSFAPNGAALLAGYKAFDHRNVNADGAFTLDLAPDAQGPGALQLTPNCRVLIVRVLHRNAHGRAAALSFEGASNSAALMPARGTSEQTLTHIAQATVRSVHQFIRWSRLNSDQPNCFTAPPPTMADEVQGDPDTHYALGRYDLAAGEWLEVDIPRIACSYWSLHAYNHWCEYLTRRERA